MSYIIPLSLFFMKKKLQFLLQQWKFESGMMFFILFSLLDLMRESVATARVTIGFLRLIFKINRDTMSQDNQPNSEQRSTTDDDGSLSSLGLKVPVVPATNDAAGDTVPALENLDNNLDTATQAQQLHQSGADEPAQHANLGNISYFNYIQLLKF